MANLTCRKDINLLNVTRTTTSTSYTSTADRNPLWRYNASDYSNVDAIYFEGVMRAAAADDAYMILTSVGGTDVTGSEITTDSTTNVVVVSGDIKANLVDGTDYRFRWKSGAGGNAAFDSASISIHQNGAVTATATVIEIGEDNNVTTSYASPTDYHIWKYEASRFDGTVTVYLELDAHCNSSGNTTYGALYDITAGSQVAGSEVTHTGDTTTTRVRSGDIKANLVDGHEYRADVKGSTTSDDAVAVKIRIHQTGTPTKTDGYIPVLNTVTSGTGSTYAYQNRLMGFNASEFAGDSVVFKYEATLKSSSGNTAYYNLYNDTDAGELAVVTTTSTSYVRSRDDTVSMPVDAGNVLNSGRKIDTSGTVTVARSFLIVQADWSSGSTATASVATVAITLSVPEVTATFASVRTASVSALATTLTLPEVTATYNAILSASVAPVSVTLSVPEVTATFSGVFTASVSAVSLTLTPTATTATYIAVFTASVTPISLTATIPAVTATYVEIDTASVDPVTLTATIPEVTASRQEVYTASVASLSITLTVVGITATYQGVWTASVSPLSTTLTTPSVTANYIYVTTASVSPITTTLTAIEVTATHSVVTTSSVAPLSLTLSPVSTTATYQEVDTATVTAIGLNLTPIEAIPSYIQVEIASVSPIETALTIPAVTATYLIDSEYSAVVEPLEMAFAVPEIRPMHNGSCTIPKLAFVDYKKLIYRVSPDGKFWISL